MLTAILRNWTADQSLLQDMSYYDNKHSLHLFYTNDITVQCHVCQQVRYCHITSRLGQSNMETAISSYIQLQEFLYKCESLYTLCDCFLQQGTDDFMPTTATMLDIFQIQLSANMTPHILKQKFVIGLSQVSIAMEILQPMKQQTCNH
jgi:hypothetical protein